MGKREYKVGDQVFKFGGIAPELMERVRLDVANGVTVDDSSEGYTADMLEYRRYFEAWIKTIPPGGHIDFPALL